MNRFLRRVLVTVLALALPLQAWAAAATCIGSHAAARQAAAMTTPDAATPCPGHDAGAPSSDDGSTAAPCLHCALAGAPALWAAPSATVADASPQTRHGPAARPRAPAYTTDAPERPPRRGHLPG